MTEMTLETGATAAGIRARFVMALLIAGMAFDVLAILSGMSQYDLLSRIAANAPFTEAEAEANDARYGMVGVLQTLIFVLTAISWLVWLHRAYSNLHLVGRKETNHTSGWAVGWWFVPIMNLLRPYQIVKELWVRSATANSDVSIKKLRAPGIVIWWWSAYLISGIFGRLFMGQAKRAETVDELLAVTRSGIILDALTIISAVLAFIVVARIASLQRGILVTITDGCSSE